MAIVSQRGRITGSLQAPVVPVTIWDDGEADVSLSAARDEAIAAVEAGIESTLTPLGLTRGADPAIEELANHVWKVGVPYRPISLSTPAAPPIPPAGTVTRLCNFNAHPKRVTNSLECLGTYNTEGLVEGFSRRYVGVEKVGAVFKTVGVQCNPLEERRVLEYIIPNVALTDSYLDDIEDLMECFNESEFFGNPAGTLQLVSVAAAVRSTDDSFLRLGFGKQKPKQEQFDGVNETTGDYGLITIPQVFGHSITYAARKDVKVTVSEGPASNVLDSLARYVFLQRVWEFGDFSKLMLPPLP